MRLGYGRVSTVEQDLAAQHRALTDDGCERIFQEKETGVRWTRPELNRLIDQLRPGDVVVVWKLDRLSRSLKDLLFLLERIHEAGAEFKSLTEAIDTTTPAGRMMMQIVGAFAEFEREMIRERTRSGIEAARADGRVGGRPRKLSGKQRQEAIEMVRSGRKSAAEVARLFQVDPSMISRLVR